MSQIIAVTGAAGWVGQAVCAALEQAGVTVRRFTRSGAPGGEGRVDLVATSVAEMERALRGCSGLVHCAAHVHRPNETAAEVAQFEAVNEAGTGKILRACRGASVGRIVFVSTSAIYCWEQEKASAEDSATLASTSYAATKLRAEAMVRESPLDWRIARLATVYGQGDRANFSRLAQALRRRRFVIPGEGTARKSVIHIARAGELLSRLALLKEGRGVTVNLASPEAPTLARICESFCQVCGFPAAPRVPFPLLRALAAAGSFIQACGLSSPLTASTLGKLTTSTVLEVRRMQTLFPDLVWPSFRESLRSDADYYRGDRSGHVQRH